MSGIVHMSEAANLGLHAMILLAGEPERTVSAKEAASLLGVSEDHLAKVLNRLVKTGLVASARGPRGGFKLGRPSGEIRLLEIYETIEGEIQSKQCLLGERRCQGLCVLGDFILKTNAEFRQHLAGIRLSEVAGAIGGTTMTQLSRPVRPGG